MIDEDKIREIFERRTRDRLQREFKERQSQIIGTVTTIALASAIAEIVEKLQIDSPTMKAYLAALNGDSTAMHALWHATRCQMTGRKMCPRYALNPPNAFNFCELDDGHEGDCDLDTDLQDESLSTP